MILKQFIEKALDCDLDLPVVLDNGNGSSSEIEDIIECKDEKDNMIVCVKVAR